MSHLTLPILPCRRETALTLVAMAAATLVGCSGGTGSGNNAAPPPDQAGPVVDAGPEFPIASSRLDVTVYSMRPGETLPPDVVRLIRDRAQSTPDELKASLAQRGFLGALLNDAALAELEHMLVSKSITAPAPVKVPAPPPSANPVITSGTSIIGADPTAPPSPDQPQPEPPPEQFVAVVPVGSAVGGVSALSIRPGAAWIPLIDADPRTEPWALSLGPSVASLKPGTLRCYVRNWPAPAEPLPTAGMSAELRVQILPVVTGPLHEVQPDPLAPPPLSTDLAARGHVLSRQAFTTGLRNGATLVLIALPAAAASTGPGPQTEAAPMLGQALLGANQHSTLGPSSGPRVLVLKAIVPGTYRLMLDRPAAAPPAPSADAAR